MTYDADLCERLAVEFAEDDARATEAPWSFIYATVRKAIGADDEYTVADIPRGKRGDTETRQGGLNGEAIVRLRNNARQAAEQLRAAVIKIDGLKAQLATAPHEVTYAEAKLACELADAKGDRDRLADRLVEADELVKSLRSWTKHGPNGSGESGACSADCLKCRAERYIAATDLEKQFRKAVVGHLSEHIAKLVRLGLEACDLASRNREIKMQIDENFYQVLHIEPTVYDKARIAAIRVELTSKETP